MLWKGSPGWVCLGQKGQKGIIHSRDHPRRTNTQERKNNALTFKNEKRGWEKMGTGMSPCVCLCFYLSLCIWNTRMGHWVLCLVILPNAKKTRDRSKLKPIQQQSPRKKEGNVLSTGLSAGNWSRRGLRDTKRLGLLCVIPGVSVYSRLRKLYSFLFFQVGSSKVDSLPYSSYFPEQNYFAPSIFPSRLSRAFILFFLISLFAFLCSFVSVSTVLVGGREGGGAIGNKFFSSPIYLRHVSIYIYFRRLPFYLPISPRRADDGSEESCRMGWGTKEKSNGQRSQTQCQLTKRANEVSSEQRKRKSR